jgi:hypothetical protein
MIMMMMMRECILREIDEKMLGRKILERVVRVGERLMVLEGILREGQWGELCTG